MFRMMNGDRYGGLKDERGCVLLNEGEKKNEIFFWQMGWHDRATTGMGRANLLENEGFFF